MTHNYQLDHSLSLRLLTHFFIIPIFTAIDTLFKKEPKYSENFSRFISNFTLYSGEFLYGMLKFLFKVNDARCNNAKITI